MHRVSQREQSYQFHQLISQRYCLTDLNVAYHMICKTAKYKANCYEAAYFKLYVSSHLNKVYFVVGYNNNQKAAIS
jgi:hypothetical protein